MGDAEIDISKEADPFLRTYGRSIDFIAFYKGSALLKKANSRCSVSDKPIIEPGPDGDRPEIILAARIPGYGNKSSSTASIRTQKWGNIQAFAIYCPQFSNDDLRYRARLTSGAWTTWTTLGNFVETTVKGENLTGFSVRLAEAAAKQFTLTVVGIFREENDPVIVGNGEECTSRFPGNELYGMQIIVKGK